MADTTGHASSPLINDLLVSGHQFSFDQIMRLARAELGPGGSQELPEVPWQERVRIRPDLSLAFPAADVARVERTGPQGADLLVTTTFLGFYGTSSPLPTHYTEDLLEEAAADSSVSRDFLDIIHQRLYQLFFQCWSKYRLFIRVAEEKNHRDRERLFCLIGLGERELRDTLTEAWSLVRYAGLLTQFPRSAAGLETLLRDALRVRKLRVEQCVLRRVPIPVDQQMCLGISGMSLGLNTVLGSEMPDRMGKIRIHIGPLPKKVFDTFQPGTVQYDKLVRLIRLYITDPLDFDLQLTLAAGEARPISLGDPNGARLGWSTWCFSGYTLGEVSAIFPLATFVAESLAPAEDDMAYPAEHAEPASLIDYYQQELARLRDLAAVYAKAHPELASMVSGHLADPGVERLLEGVAFLNANLQLKLADDFPEVIHQLIEAFQPWHARPIPAATIVAFTPKAGLVQPLLIHAGAEVASLPVQGTTCRFRTCFDVTVQPLTLLNAAYSQPSGKAPRIDLSFQLNGLALSSWNVKSLSFFLGDDRPAACDLYLLLMRYLKRIILTSDDGVAMVELAADCLKPAGFGAHEAMLAADSASLPGHLLLQEYFVFPDKFLFFDLSGLERCRELGGGSRLRISFELGRCPYVVPEVHPGSFVLSCVPVINLFAHTARPVSFVSELQQHALRPEGDNPAHYQIYSVDRIEGLVKNESSKLLFAAHNPLLRRSKDSTVCHITQGKSPLRDGFDSFITIPSHVNGGRTARIKLNIDLTCTNGSLPEQLNIGDVCSAAKGIPESVEHRNITVVTAAIPQDDQHNRHWRLLAGFSLNSVSLNGIDNFRALLRVFILSNCRDLATREANKRRIEGITAIDALPADRLMKGRMYRGYEVRLNVRGDHYSGPGDLYLFCSVLERFLGGYVTQNCFIRLVVEEIGKGFRFEWPARMGDQCVV